jgi:hypothetical protein
VDWSTYTTALRLRTVGGKGSAFVIAELLGICVGRLHQNVGQTPKNGVAGRPIRRNGNCMMNLPGARGFIGACSPESEGLQQPIQIGQTGHVDYWRAERHRRAHGGIKHPGGKDDRDAQFSLYNNDFRSRPPLRVKLPDPAAIQRVPAIMDPPRPCRYAQNERPTAIGRKSWLFAGSDRGGERATAMYSLIATARLNYVDPRAWLADVLARIADHPA